MQHVLPGINTYASLGAGVSSDESVQAVFHPGEEFEATASHLAPEVTQLHGQQPPHAFTPFSMPPHDPSLVATSTLSSNAQRQAASSSARGAHNTVSASAPTGTDLGAQVGNVQRLPLVAQVALMDGVTMGGGAGLCMNGLFRVVTERCALILHAGPSQELFAGAERWLACVQHLPECALYGRQRPERTCDLVQV